MRASAHYVLRNLGRRRARSVLGVLGVFLTLAFLTSIHIGLESVSRSYTDLAALQAGKADLVVLAEGGSLLRPEPFPEEEVERKLAGNPHLRGFAPRLAGVAQAGAGAADHQTVLIGLDAARERALDISGLVPEPDVREGVAAVSRNLARRLKVKVGDTVALRSVRSEAALTLRVGTIVERQLILPQEVKDFVVTDVMDARILLEEPVLTHALAGALRDPGRYYDARDLQASVRQLKNAGAGVAATLGAGYEVRVPKATAIAAFQNFTAPVRAFFGVFALLALSITGLLIYSIVSVGVEERIREYAILRTLGGKRRDIVRLVLGEALVLCVLGVVPGVLTGILFARWGVRLVERMMKAEGDAIALHLSPGSLWLAAGAGVLLAIGSSLIPALQAVRWRIVDALDPLRRGQIPSAQNGEHAGNRPLVLVGVSVSVLSVIIFFVLPAAFVSGDPSIIGSVVLGVLVTILLGFTLVAVGALPLVERIVMRAIGGLLGPAAEMAHRNLSRHRRRNTTTAIMFILSVSWVVFIASLAALFSRTSMAMVEHFNGAYIRINAAAPDAVALKEDLSRVEGVVAVSEVNFLRGRTQAGVAYDVVLGDLVGMKQLWVVPFGVDPDLARVVFKERIQYTDAVPGALERLAAHGAPPREQAGAVRAVAPVPDSGVAMVESETYAAPPPGAEPVGNGEDEPAPLILSESAARFLDVRRGDLVQLTFRLGAARQERRFRIEAVCSALPGFENFRSRVANAVGSGVLLPLASFQAMTRLAPPDAFQARYYVKTAADEEVQRGVAAQIRDRFDLRYRFGVRSTIERKAEAKKLYWATQILFGLLLGVAIVIAVFALIASMITAAIERRWELGMLKALGLRRGQLYRMFLGETVGLTLSAGLLGGAIGFSLAYLFVVQAAALIEVPVVFTLPYLTFAATFAACVVAGVLAAYLPTRRLLRRPPAEILRSE